MENLERPQYMSKKIGEALRAGRKILGFNSVSGKLKAKIFTNTIFSHGLSSLESFGDAEDKEHLDQQRTQLVIEAMKMVYAPVSKVDKPNFAVNTLLITACNKEFGIGMEEKNLRDHFRFQEAPPVPYDKLLAELKRDLFPQGKESNSNLGTIKADVDKIVEQYCRYLSLLVTKKTLDNFLLDKERNDTYRSVESGLKKSEEVIMQMIKAMAEHIAELPDKEIGKIYELIEQAFKSATSHTVDINPEAAIERLSMALVNSMLALKNEKDRTKHTVSSIGTDIGRQVQEV